jgi:general secretion pathway protein D
MSYEQVQSKDSMKPWLFIAIVLTCIACPAQEDLGARLATQPITPAEKSFQHAVELQKDGQLDGAFQELVKASTLAPDNREYLTARELLRSRIAGKYIERGNVLAGLGDEKGAGAQFKSALSLDPQNGYAQERLHELSPEEAEHEHILQLLASVEEVKVVPNAGKSNFHIHGDTRQLYDAIAHAFGIMIDYDSGLTTQRVRFDVDDLDFDTAMRLAGKVTRTFWAPVASKKAIVANDTQEMRKQYERVSLQTFYVSEAATPAEMNDIANVLKTVFEVKLVSVVPDKNIITVRGPRSEMEAISAMVDDLMKGRPEVLLDIKAYELDYSNLQQYGLALPNSFSIFNIYGALYEALGPNAQTVINQLQTTGTINPSSVPAGSLANLQSSPLLQPFIFFGNGYGLTGITVAPISGQLISTTSHTTDLEHVTLRGVSGVPATLMIGERYPISLGSFTNVSITTTGQPQVGTAFPQFQYEDLGLIFKATPHLQTGDNVNLELELQIKGLGAETTDNIPVLTNRAYKGSITVKDGEPSEVASVVEDEVDRSLSGYPGPGQFPLLSSVISTNSKQHTWTQVLIVITPHIVRKSFHNLDNVVWDVGQ